jgi:DNA-binding response OmpR family regulator
MNERNHSPAGESGHPAPQSPTRPSWRILVVDDDSDIRRLNAEMLKRLGYEVNAAADGADGWEALNAARYDLLITDNDMPNVSGIELLKKLRAARMVLPVIMATGRLPTQEFDRHPWLQPAATLLKPYSVEEFLGTVEKVLHATDGVRSRNALPLDWQRRPPTEGLRL